LGGRFLRTLSLHFVLELCKPKGHVSCTNKRNVSKWEITRIVGFGMTTVAQLIYYPLGRIWLNKPRNSGTWPSSREDRCLQIPKKLKDRCNAAFLFAKTQVKWATQYSTHSQCPFHIKRSKSILLDTRVMSLGFV